MSTRLQIGDEFCNSFEQLQGFISVLPNATEVYSDILEYARNGTLSNWLREHDKGAFAKKIDSIDDRIGDNAFISKISSILLGGIPKVKKPHFSSCFKARFELSHTKDNKLILMLSLTPTKQVNEEYEIKGICGEVIKKCLFNPSRHTLNVAKKMTLTFDNLPLEKIDNIIVLIDGEGVYNEDINDYYYNDKIDVLNKRIYLGSLSNDFLKSIILHYFKTKPVYDISRISNDNFEIDDFLKTIHGITGVDISVKTISGKTINKAFESINAEILQQEEVNRKSFKQSLSIDDKLSITHYKEDDIISLINECCEKKNYNAWDSLTEAQLNIKRLLNELSSKFGLNLPESDITRNYRMDNLEMFIITTLSDGVIQFSRGKGG